MPRTKLTQLATEKLKTPGIHWDTHLPGFGIRITPKGKKSWIAFYRVNGKQVVETLGTLPQIPKVEDARQRGGRKQIAERRDDNAVDRHAGEHRRGYGTQKRVLRSIDRIKAPRQQAHDGMHGTGLDGQVKAVENLLAIDLDVQVPNGQHITSLNGLFLTAPSHCQLCCSLRPHESQS